MAFLKKIIKRTPDTIDNNEIHQSFSVANPYDFQAIYKRLGWLLRISMMGNIAFIIAILVLSMTIYEAYPLKRVEIALVERVPATNQLLRIQPLSKDIDGFNILLEATASRFVKNLLEIDTITQKGRYNEAFAMMDSKPYKEFKQSRIDNKAVDEFITQGLTRAINVESCDNVAGANRGVYKYSCEFTQTDTKNLNKAIISQKLLRAYIAFELHSNEVIEQNKYQNPLGIFVIDFTLKERFQNEK